MSEAREPGLELRDTNGNYRVINSRWIKYDADNRPVRIVTADGTKTEFAYDYSIAPRTGK